MDSLFYVKILVLNPLLVVCAEIYRPISERYKVRKDYTGVDLFSLPEKINKKGFSSPFKAEKDKLAYVKSFDEINSFF